MPKISNPTNRITPGRRRRFYLAVRGLCVSTGSARTKAALAASKERGKLLVANRTEARDGDAGRTGEATALGISISSS
jgi:hypothetical protein